MAAWVRGDGGDDGEMEGAGEAGGRGGGAGTGKELRVFSALVSLGPAAFLV